MFRRFTIRSAIGIAVLFLAASTGPPARAQHGGLGGHTGHSGHGGGYGHGASGHYGGLSHYGGLGHYDHYGYDHHAHSLDYHHHDLLPHVGFYWGPSYGYFGYGSWYGPAYWPGALSYRPWTYCLQPDPVTRDATSSFLADRSTITAAMTEAGLLYQRRAEDAFRAGVYSQALRLASHAAVEMPRNGKLQLFISQTLFALGEYQEAVAALHQGTSLLESKDWGRVVQDYAQYYRNEDYVKQMDRLVEFIAKNPNAAYAWTLRGYHYGYLGHKEAARSDLAKAVELDASDKLAVRLLEVFGGSAPKPPAKAEKANSSKDNGREVKRGEEEK